MVLVIRKISCIQTPYWSFVEKRRLSLFGPCIQDSNCLCEIRQKRPVNFFKDSSLVKFTYMNMTCKQSLRIFNKFSEILEIFTERKNWWPRCKKFQSFWILNIMSALRFHRFSWSNWILKYLVYCETLPSYQPYLEILKICRDM